VAGYVLRVVVLNSDGEAAVVAVLIGVWGRRQERWCLTISVKVSAATSFMLGDDLRGGGRGEAADSIEEDEAAWRGLLNRGGGNFRPELSEWR
jgi:hypothetical protein